MIDTKITSKPTLLQLSDRITNNKNWLVLARMSIMSLPAGPERNALETLHYRLEDDADELLAEVDRMRAQEATRCA